MLPVSSGSPVEPSCNAQIFAGNTLLQTVGEGFLSLPAPSAAADFDIPGAGITKMIVQSDNNHFAAFPSVLLVNFVLTRAL